MTANESLPTRERGLKYGKRDCLCPGGWGAPHAGAWIEIRLGTAALQKVPGRSPRGSVD